MRATITVDVSTQKDAVAIERALSDPAVKAFTIIVGTLLPLSRAHQVNILTFIRNYFDIEEREG